MKEVVTKKIFEVKKIKPLFGHNCPKRGKNRRPVTNRKFTPNWQKFHIGSQTYQIPVKLFRTYWVKLRKGNYKP